MSLRNKKPLKVVITAGASGIGLAITQKFMKEGAMVFICDIAEDALNRAINENPGLLGAVANVGDSKSIEQFFSDAIEKLGGIDVLINNAGIGGPRAAVEDIEYSDWDNCIHINLSGMFYCVKQVVPLMKRQGGGSIINISTSSAKTGLPNRLPYVASKVGVLGLSHNLARELGPSNIRVNTILPGLMDNPRGRALVESYAQEKNVSVEQAEEDFLEYISLRRWTNTEDIANTAYWLCSEGAKQITGQEIAVDGNCEWEV